VVGLGVRAWIDLVYAQQTVVHLIDGTTMGHYAPESKH
jgi:hypothetical protein